MKKNFDSIRSAAIKAVMIAAVTWLARSTAGAFSVDTNITLRATLQNIEVRSNTATIRLELANALSAPVRLSGFSMSATVFRVDLTDADGRRWQFQAPRMIGDPPVIQADYRQVISPQKTLTMIIGDSRGLVPVANSVRSVRPKTLNYVLQESVSICSTDFKKLRYVRLTGKGTVPITWK